MLTFEFFFIFYVQAVYWRMHI